MYINTILGNPKVNANMVLNKFIFGVNPILCPKKWHITNTDIPHNMDITADIIGYLRLL